jgi:NAD+ diphosphatase
MGIHELQDDFQNFIPAVVPPAGPEQPAWWFIFREGKLLVRRNGSGCVVPWETDPDRLGLTLSDGHYLGSARGVPCYAAEAGAADTAPDGWSFEGLRSLFDAISEGFLRVAGRASQVLDWDRTHRFCGKCGGATVVKPGERARECLTCKLLFYPRLSPAVIVAVTRGDRILLARSPRFAPGYYSVLAGFVEPGETLEECVRREVREETAIEVSNVRYLQSQPWPFPNSLMLAFTAMHASGEISIDRVELVEAGWFSVEGLPSIPGRLTVARRLIDWFIEGFGRRG